MRLAASLVLDGDSASGTCVIWILASLRSANLGADLRLGDTCFRMLSPSALKGAALGEEAIVLKMT